MARAVARFTLTLSAAAWVSYLAVRLWRLPDRNAMGPEQNGALKLFITTLSNPKGLIIGLVLLPSQPHLAPASAIFLTILLVVSGIWAGIGQMAGRCLTLSPCSEGLRRVARSPRRVACHLGLHRLTFQGNKFASRML